MPTKTLTEAEVCERYQISPSTLRRSYYAAKFPAPMKIGGHIRRWNESVLDKFDREAQAAANRLQQAQSRAQKAK